MQVEHRNTLVNLNSSVSGWVILDNSHVLLNHLYFSLDYCNETAYHGNVPPPDVTPAQLTTSPHRTARAYDHCTARVEIYAAHLKYSRPYEIEK